MALLLLSSNKAERNPDGASFAVSYDGGRTSPLPQEQVEIRTAADAAAALSTYADKVRATGLPAYVSASLVRGYRAPAGFRKLKLYELVNA